MSQLMKLFSYMKRRKKIIRKVHRYKCSRGYAKCPVFGCTTNDEFNADLLCLKDYKTPIWIRVTN